MLGAIVYHLLTGRPPFQGETVTEVTHQVVHNDPLAPRLLLRQCPRDLETICLKCLEKDPARRYQTARELAEELERFMRGEPILARPVTVAEQAWRWCRRKPAIASLGLATLLLLLAVAIGSPLAAFRIARERNTARREENTARRERERADQNLYDADMSLAQHTWDSGDLGGTLGLLEAHQRRPGEPDRREFEWRYFRNLCRGDQQMTLRGHQQAVSCAVFSPDGKLLATGSAGDLVRIWNRETGKLVTTLPEQIVVSLAFSPDGLFLGVGGRDQVAVRNLETKQVIFEEKEAFAQFNVAFSPAGPAGGLLVVGRGSQSVFHEGGSTELWDYHTGQRKHVFPESGGYIAVSRNGNRLATAGGKQFVNIWDPATGQLITNLNGEQVVAMALSPDGNTLAVSNWDSKVALWDIATSSKVSLTNNLRRAWSLAFSPDGKSLAAGGANQTIRLWDVRTLQQSESFRGHGSEVMSVGFSADGLMLASGSKDKTAMLWSVHPVRFATVVSNVMTRPIFSPDGQLVAAGVGEDRVTVWDVATLEPRAILTNARSALAFSANGRELLTRGTNYFVRTFDVATWAMRQTVSHGPVEETGFNSALSPDGQTLACGSPDGTLTFASAKTGALLATKPGAYAKQFFQLSFSPNGKLLATAGGTTEADTAAPAAKLWDTATGEIVARPTGHAGLVLGAAFSQDGKTLVTCGTDDSVKLWNTTTWRELAPSLGEKDYLEALAMSPNGRTLATACSDGTVKLWNLATRREVSSFLLGEQVMHLAFSPDGQTLAARTWGDVLRLWRAPALDKITPASRP